MPYPLLSSLISSANTSCSFLMLRLPEGLPVALSSLLLLVLLLLARHSGHLFLGTLPLLCVWLVKAALEDLAQAFRSLAPALASDPVLGSAYYVIHCAIGAPFVGAPS